MKTPKKQILLSHGSGGRMSHDLIRGLLLKKLHNPILKELSDSARIDYRDKLAFTTDSFVVSPLFFPGGDIGKLSVCGTVNDLVMLGARPEYLSLALIVEEGLDYKVLSDIVDSVAVTAKEAGVSFVTGDLKVVEKGAADKIFINTAGIGRIVSKNNLSARNIRPGDSVIVTGEIGQHGLAVLARRKELGLGFRISSDCALLSGLLLGLAQKSSAIKFMRDPTRGGLATALKEAAESSSLGIALDEKHIPVSQNVRAACELLGMDPLYIANEGKAVLVVERKEEKKILRALKRHPLGRRARIIGRVTGENRGRVVLKTALGTERFLDMLSGEPLPRIC